MMPLIDAEQPRRARRRNPKVKTGCRTCKVRRIKCDESKPSCRRCTSTGRTCDGYSTSSTDFQVQVWNNHQNTNVERPISALTDVGNNIRYIEFYHQYARPMLSSSFDKEFWSQTVLQLAHSERAIRHGLIALGALFRSEDGSMKFARSRAGIESEQGTLLSHYNLSIKSLIQSMAEPSFTPEVALVACMIFVCVELLRGNYHSGYTHFSNGLKIISEYQKRIQGTNAPPIPELSGTEIAIRPSHMLDEKIVSMYTRSISSALMYGVSADQFIKIPVPASPTYRPFAGVREAQMAYYELRNASIVRLRLTSHKVTSKTVSSEDLEHVTTLLQCHNSWGYNFELLRGAGFSDDEKLTSSILKASHYTSYIYLACATEARQTQYDAHLESFRKIMRHVKYIMDSRSVPASEAAHYTLELSVIPTLYIVATRCRCPITRREAVALLAKRPPREGMWDADQHVIAANRAIEMEETEIDTSTGWPVEHTRLWSCVVSAGMDENGGFWVWSMPAKWIGKVPADELDSKHISELHYV